MAYTYKKLNFNINLKNGISRATLRKNLISEFLEEDAGSGKEDLASRFEYIVDSTTDGIEISLKRPAPLNKGMDFLVSVPKGYFNSRGIPSHKNIIDDLLEKKKENSTNYLQVMNIIKKMYDSNIIPNKFPKFSTGFDIELVLKVLFWLFAEQDVTYWNWSGKAMLYENLKELDLTN